MLGYGNKRERCDNKHECCTEGYNGTMAQPSTGVEMHGVGVLNVSNELWVGACLVCLHAGTT